MRGLPAAFQPAKPGLEEGRRGWGEPAVPGDEAGSGAGVRGGQGCCGWEPPCGLGELSRSGAFVMGKGR